MKSGAETSECGRLARDRRNGKGDHMTSGKRLAVAVGIGLVTLFGSLSAAEAQYRQRPYYGPAPTPRMGVYRSGLTVGGGIGAGVTQGPNCFSLCGGAGMGEVH